jgi:hypothetical protein
VQQLDLRPVGRVGEQGLDRVVERGELRSLFTLSADGRSSNTPTPRTSPLPSSPSTRTVCSAGWVERNSSANAE